MQLSEVERLVLEKLKAAYAPYSKFRVAACVLSESGKPYFGVNVENVSFGLTMCAERVALGTAVADGCRSFSMLVLASDSETPIVPCGACRQVLAEFSPDLLIQSVTQGGSREEFQLSTLLPSPKQGILSA